jgi:hypothetical protein
MSDAPIKRFTLLVLFQAQQDHASELVIDPVIGTKSPIRYKVGSNWYDFSLPPVHIIPGVRADVGRLAGFTDGAFPKEGIIDVPFSGVRLHWRACQAAEDAECVLAPA